MYRKARRLTARKRRLLLIYLYWLHAREHTARARFPLLAALLSLLLLAFLPAHPLTIPTAVGLAASLTLIIAACLPRRRAAYWVGT